MEQIRFSSFDGEDILAYVVEETMLSGVKYLLVAEDELEDCEAYILKVVSEEDDDQIYEMVEDEVEFEAVAKLFEELVGEEADLEY